MTLEDRSEEDITFRKPWGSDMVRVEYKFPGGPQLVIALPLVCVQFVSLLVDPTNSSWPQTHLYILGFEITKATWLLRGDSTHRHIQKNTSSQTFL